MNITSFTCRVKDEFDPLPFIFSRKSKGCIRVIRVISSSSALSRLNPSRWIRQNRALHWRGDYSSGRGIRTVAAGCRRGEVSRRAVPPRRRRKVGSGFLAENSCGIFSRKGAKAPRNQIALDPRTKTQSQTRSGPVFLATWWLGARIFMAFHNECPERPDGSRGPFAPPGRRSADGARRLTDPLKAPRQPCRDRDRNIFPQRRRAGSGSLRLSNPAGNSGSGINGDHAGTGIGIFPPPQDADAKPDLASWRKILPEYSPAKARRRQEIRSH